MLCSNHTVAVISLLDLVQIYNKRAAKFFGLNTL